MISLVDDALIEQMRQKLGRDTGRELPEIGNREEDSRARRIASYLDLLDDLVDDHEVTRMEIGFRLLSTLGTGRRKRSRPVRGSKV